MKRKLILLLLVVAGVAGYRSLLFVDETEMVIVTQFGRPVQAYRCNSVRLCEAFPWVEVDCSPAGPRDAGLHFKMPYQSAIRIDRRLQIYDPPPSEFLTEEKKNVDLDVFVCWRVDDPQRFLETVADPAGAEMRMHDVVMSELSDKVASNSMDALVSVPAASGADPASPHRLDALISEVADQCALRVKEDFGIEIVDVRLKRITLPSQNRESVFRRMRSERSRIAQQYRAEGQREATQIIAKADKERDVIMADAAAEAETMRGDAEARATGIYAAAHQTDPEFYELLRTLEAYKKFLDEKTTILLSAESDLLKYLTRGSMLDESPESN